jgi:hypothetical protein
VTSISDIKPRVIPNSYDRETVSVGPTRTGPTFCSSAASARAQPTPAFARHRHAPPAAF